MRKTLDIIIGEAIAIVCRHRNGPFDAVDTSLNAWRCRAECCYRDLRGWAEGRLGKAWEMTALAILFSTR